MINNKIDGLTQYVEKHFEQNQDKNTVMYLKKLEDNHRDEQNEIFLEQKENIVNEKDNDEEDAEEKFLSQFPGVKSLYANYKNRPNKKGVSDGTSGFGPKSWMTITVYLLLLLFTCLLLFLRPLRSENYVVYIVNNQIVTNLKLVSDLTSLVSFLKSSGSLLLINPTSSVAPPLRTQTVLIGPIRLRAQRRSKTNCDVNLGDSLINWYSDTESTDDIGDATYSWQSYTSASSNGIKLDIDGNFGTYGGGGYVVDFDPMDSVDKWNDKISELVNNGYFDQSIMWLFVTFTSYNPTTGGWISVNMLFEFSKMGLISPSSSITKIFIPNIFETSEEQGLRAVEFLRLFLSIYLVVFWIVVKIVQLPSINRIFSIEMILHLGWDIAIVWFIISIFAIVIVMWADSTQTLVNAKTYTDFTYIAYLYKLIFILESYLLNLILLKLLQSFSVFKIVRIVILSIGLSLRMMVAYTIIFFPILIWFAVIGMEIWGPFSSDYKNFLQSFISTMYFMLGQSNAYSLVEYNRVWTLIYMTVFFLIFSHMVIWIIVAIYSDSYRLIILAEGYQEEKKKETNYKATLIKIFAWILGWLTFSALKRIGLKTNFEAENELEISEEEEQD